MSTISTGRIVIDRLEARSLIALDMSAIVVQANEITSFGQDIRLGQRIESAGLIREIAIRTPRTWGMDRLERHTMGHRIVDQLPVGADLVTPLSGEASRSRVNIGNVILGAHGILVIEGRTIINTDGGLEIAEAVEELRVARRVVDMLSETVFREAATALRPDFGSSSSDIIRGLVEERSGRYDIYDFDAHLRDDPTADWGALLDNRATLQELTGFVRLSRPGVWQHYGEKFCKDFLSEVDLGRRDDDLWAIHGRRLFRRHPEAVSRQDVQDYFDDVTIIVSVLLSMEAALETIAERFTALSPDILRRIGTDARAVDQVTADLAEIVEVLPTVLSPNRIHEHFGHPFFQSLTAAFELSLRLSVLRGSVQQQVNGLLGAATAVASNMISSASLRSARRVEALTIVTVILTVTMLVFTVLQIITMLQGGNP